jgi:hypothetical protein
MKNSRDINEIITKEESADEPPSNKNRRANIPENWDQDF